MNKIIIQLMSDLIFFKLKLISILKALESQ